MPHELINLNSDLKKLSDVGYAIQVIDGYLLLRDVPYVNSNCQIKYGILVSDLVLSGMKTINPVQDHVAHFVGEHPCNNDGTIIQGIRHTSQDKKLIDDLVINHSFSNKPSNGYPDYYEKMSNYANIISAQAKALDDSITEKPFKEVASNDPETVFKYIDTNSCRASIKTISSKLEGRKIAIVGLGGTGAYILDLVAKTPVAEIHIFDGDIFCNHNAFRSPGAPSIDELKDVKKKTDYLQAIYSKMHKDIIPHSYYLSEANVEELSNMSFVFLCLDKGTAKRSIVDHLLINNISFVDVGMGLLTAEDYLLGQLRVTACTPEKQDHIETRIPFTEPDAYDAYSTNIQIADLNALNAILAVLKWKKLAGFYQDLSQEFNTVYSINDGTLHNEDNLS